jgi:NCS1 family nucleobase:cation symporter-1
MTFLYMIGSVFTPLYGVLLIDHFVIRKRRIVATDIIRLSGVYGFTYGVHISAFAAWAAGVATYYSFLSFLPAAGATLPAFFVAAFSYWALAKLFAKSDPDL